MKYDLTQYKAIVFDYDGVVIDSQGLKDQLFRQLFANYQDKIEEIDKYNRSMHGVSRFIKFKYVYENILGLPYSDELGEGLNDEFNRLFVEEFQRPPLIKGIKEFFKQQTQEKYVSSSAPASEIGKSVKDYGIEHFFAKLYGYPVSKAEALKDVIKTKGYQGNQVLFFGDAKADFEAAQEAGADFIARNENIAEFPEGTRAISDFTELLTSSSW